MKKIILMLMAGLWTAGAILSAQELPETRSYHVGAFEITVLPEAQTKGNPNILIGATPEMLRQCIPESAYPSAANVFLIRTPEKNVLVDAGYGTRLFEHLDKFGIKSDQIDVVFLTHMHGDHIGGMLHGGKAAFPNAEVYLSQPEYDFWTSDEQMRKMPENRRGGFENARKVTDAYQANLHLFEPDGAGAVFAALIPGFEAMAAYGHTPGHTAYIVGTGVERLLIWGDLTHAMAIQMPYPQVAVTYDTDPQQAIATRLRVLRYVSQNRIPVGGMHVPFPGMGFVEDAGNGGYRFTPVGAK